MQVKTSLNLYWTGKFKFQWMGKAGLWIIFILNVIGEVTNMKMFRSCFAKACTALPSKPFQL